MIPSAPAIAFVIEDELHAEVIGTYPTRDAALAALRALAALPWDAAPNRAPCTGWQGCGRLYEVVAYGRASTPWRALSRDPGLRVHAAGIEWLLPIDA